jgi:serine/threonine protein kinase
VLTELCVESVALPVLGCELGGLHWRDVRARIEQELTDLPVRVLSATPCIRVRVSDVSIHVPVAVPTAPLGEFAGFVLVRPLGLPGSFGTVFEAERGKERFALKLFHAPLLTVEQEERFRREVEVLRQAAHPNLVPYADSGVASVLGRRLPWIAMPYLEGRSLLDELSAGGGVLAAARVRRIARQITMGLGALHALKIVHRDLKPANVLIGADDVVRILDFGVARFLDRTTMTERGALMGSPAYSSPEQLRGESDLATDLWALGVVMYELLAGRRPFVAEDLAALVDAIRDEQPEPPSAHRPEVPRELDELVLELLAKEPMRRPPSAEYVGGLLIPSVREAPRRIEPLPDGREPLIFLRVGQRDADAAVNACLRGELPTGLVVPISERNALVVAGRAARAHDLSFGVDHLLWRMASSNFSRTKALRELPYAPRGLSPWRPEDLRSLEASRRVAHEVVEAQIERAANMLFAANFYFDGLDDPWLKRDAALLGDSLQARDAHGAGRRMFAPIAAAFEPLTSETALLSLANRLSRGRPDGYWLLLDGVAPPGTVAHLIFSLRLARLLQEQLGVEVIIGRAGALRHVFLACGVAGVEVGLGRLVGFRRSDFVGSQGGRGHAPAQWDTPSLLCWLSRDKARAVLESGEIPESTCSCRTCRGGAASLGERLDAAAEHNASMLYRDRLELAGMPVADRIDRLRSNIDRAQALGRRLRARKLLTAGDLEHLTVWTRTLDEVAESGLLRRGRAARRQAG